MADDYGEAVFMETIHKNPTLLVCESRTTNGHFHLFRKTKTKRLANGNETTYFQCKRCCEIGNGVSARVSVSNGRVMKNPDGGHHPYCVPMDRANVEALKLKREMVQNMADGGARPLQVYRQGLAEIPRRFPDQDLQEAVELAVPSFKRIRSSLYGTLAKNVIPVQDINNIPIQFQLTLRGREARDHQWNHPLTGERMLLYNGNGIAIFMSDLDLEILQGSEFWIGDGTFEMVPPEFAQLYTIHAFYNGEAIPCCHALLPNKSRQTYDILFTEIRNALLNHHQNIGRVHTVLMDFEIAAHDAVRAALQIQTRGCIFHFSQALIRRVQSEGFLQTYENNPTIQEWIKLIKTLALLPPDLVYLVWNQWLINLPPMADQLLKQKLIRFRDYFQETWLFGRFDVTLWNHFGNDWHQNHIGWDHPSPQPGPRTTNHAEGWHNRLNHDFGHPHPVVNKFLHWLQQCHHANQVRIRQLKDGEQPRARNPVYARIDSNIAQQKTQFTRERGLMPIQAAPQQMVRQAEQYMRYLLHILG